MSTIDNRVDYGDARLVEAEELRLYHQLDRDPDERLEKSIGIGVRAIVADTLIATRHADPETIAARRRG